MKLQLVEGFIDENAWNAAMTCVESELSSIESHEDFVPVAKPFSVEPA